MSSMPLSTRDDQRDPVAGKILAIILGTTVSSIAVMFGLFCLWLWRRIKKQKKLEEEEAARAVQEGRTSNADTVIEGTDNELQTVGSTDQVKETGTDKGVTHTTQTAIA